MPRIARAVIPGIAHHVTQRGNRREDIFLGSSAEFVGEITRAKTGLMEMPHLWKSAKGADSRKLLGKVRTKSARTFPIAAGPATILAI